MTLIDFQKILRLRKKNAMTDDVLPLEEDEEKVTEVSPNPESTTMFINADSDVSAKKKYKMIDLAKGFRPEFQSQKLIEMLVKITGGGNNG